MQARHQLSRITFREEHYTRLLEMKQAEIDRLGRLLQEEQRRYFAAEIVRARLEGTNQFLSAERDASKQREQDSCARLRGRIEQLSASLDSLHEKHLHVMVQLGQAQGEARAAEARLKYANEDISRLKQERVEATESAAEVGMRPASAKPN
jgi:chromosome segregation ATPase